MLICCCLLNTIIVIIIEFGDFSWSLLCYTQVLVLVSLEANIIGYWVMDIGCLSWYHSNPTFCILLWQNRPKILLPLHSEITVEITVVMSEYLVLNLLRQCELRVVKWTWPALTLYCHGALPHWQSTEKRNCCWC